MIPVFSTGHTYLLVSRAADVIEIQESRIARRRNYPPRTMVVLGDLRPIFYTARFLGCGYHLVTEDDIKLTRRGYVYTSFCAFIYLISFVLNFCVLADQEDMDSKLLMLTIARTTLSYLCLFVDIVLTHKWNWKVRSAFALLRSFDRATRYTKPPDKLRNQIVCVFFMVFVIIFWAVVGYLAYESEPVASVFNGLVYSTVSAAISIQTLCFLCISYVLGLRFRRLCEMLLVGEAEGKLMLVDYANRRFRLQEVWWLHCSLANATETINSVYTVQLLLWIASMSFNIVSRIYTINETPDIPLALKLRESMLVTAFAGNLLLITTICHATATQANRVGKVLFSPLSFVARNRNSVQLQDNVEAAAYFQLRKVHFFAASGLIRIDLPLLLSIASGITTYLVILHAASGT